MLGMQYSITIHPFCAVRSKVMFMLRHINDTLSTTCGNSMQVDILVEIGIKEIEGVI